MIVESLALPSLGDLQRGIHPDLVNINESKMTKAERRRLAMSLTLRDAFTPLCQGLQESVLALDTSEITNIAEGFKYEPRVAPYPEDFEHLVQAKGQTISELLALLRQSGHSFDNNNLSREEMEIFHLFAVYNSMAVNLSPEKIDYEDVLYCAPGRFERFLYAPTEVQRRQHRESVIVPVGAYGEAVARKMIQTARVLMHVTNSTLADQAYELADQYEWLVGDLTARGKDFVPYGGQVEDENKFYPLLTVDEGVESLNGDISFLMPELLPGMSDGDVALNVLVRRKLQNVLAARVPAGFLMPKIFAGRYLPGIITSDADRGVHRISDAAVALFDEKLMQSRYDLDNPDEALEKRYPGISETLAGFVGDWDLADYYPGDPDDLIRLSGRTAGGCPVARRQRGAKDSGIEMISEAYLHVYNSLP